MNIKALFNKALPKMSKTEQEALEAGESWWDADLFSGDPNWRNLLNVGFDPLTAEEQLFINDPVQKLCDMLDDYDITSNLKDLPPDVWKFMKDNKFFGLHIPKQYGGLDFSNYAHSRIILKIASRSTSAAVTAMVPNSLGPAKLIMKYGTEMQKENYLPALATGTLIPAFALTSPTAGSDAGSISDSGVVCMKDGIIGLNLNWKKRYITLGPVCDVLGLAFKMYDPDNLLKDGFEKDEFGCLGITVALINTVLPGVTIGDRHDPLDMAFMNGPNEGKDVFIPLTDIIGGLEYAGKGWKMLVECLTVGRAISLPTLAVAASKTCAGVTGAYAALRKQFKLPISKFGGVEEKLTEIAGYTYMIDATENLTLSALDAGFEPSVISAIVKSNLTELSRRVVNHSMDIHGGSGICQGKRNLIANLYKSIPISITVEGANILTRSMIIFGQGVMRSHPYVLLEMYVASRTGKKADEFFNHLIKEHILSFFKNVFRAFVGSHFKRKYPYNLTDKLSRKYSKRITRMSSAFALMTDVLLLTLGGKLKREEKISGRMADILSYMYIASSCIWQRKQTKIHGSAIFEWSMQTCLFEIQTAFDDLLNNLPNNSLAWILRKIIFPLGLPYKKPSDALGKMVAGVITKSDVARDKLIEGIYLSTDTNKEQIAKLNVALAQNEYFNETENHLVDEIIQVDSYKSEELKKTRNIII